MPGRPVADRRQAMPCRDSWCSENAAPVQRGILGNNRIGRYYLRLRQDCRWVQVPPPVLLIHQGLAATAASRP